MEPSSNEIGPEPTPQVREDLGSAGREYLHDLRNMIGKHIMRQDLRMDVIEEAQKADATRWERVIDMLRSLQSTVDQMIGANNAQQAAKADVRNSNNTWMWAVGLLVTAGVGVSGVLIGLTVHG